MVPMKTLSMLQPWASLIQGGHKRLETRGWRTPYRGLLAIHAAQRRLPALTALQQLPPFQEVLADQVLPYGVLVAVCELVDIVPIEAVLADPRRYSPAPYELSFGHYQPGEYAWQLAHIRPLPTPIPMKGHQGLRNCAPDVLAEIVTQLGPLIAPAP